MWLLTQQNHYRSFENMDAKQIIKAVLNPYLEDVKLNSKFSVIYECEPMDKRVQTIQLGENDYDFLIRLMNEEGLSYFFYHDTVTAHLVIVHNIPAALRKIKTKFQKITKNLPFLAKTNYETEPGVQIENSQNMSLYNYQISLIAPTAKCRILSNPDYRVAESTVNVQVPQSSKLFSNMDGFQSEITFFLPTNKLIEFTKTKKEEHLKKRAESFLETDFSSKSTFSADTHTFGFLPIWQICDVDLNISGKERMTTYKSKITNKRSFYAYAMDHRFDESLGCFYVECRFFNTNDDSFSPSHDPVKHHNATCIATVVNFKSDDTTSNNFDVPNTFRIRLPWHEANQSVKTRVSFFWASQKYGSLFMPESGSEVIVTFLEDDPDYPIIIGALYNSKNDYPLDVKDREKVGKFGARGIIFKDNSAQFVFETEKKQNNEVKTMTIETSDGNIEIAASNIETNAKKTFTLNTIDPKSQLKMDDSTVLLNGLDNGGTLKIEKTKMSATSNSISLNADA